MRTPALIGGLLAFCLGGAPALAQVEGQPFALGAVNYPSPEPNFRICNFKQPTTFTNVWYIDPVNGFAQNDYTNGTNGAPTVVAIGGASGQGTATHPWKSLKAVFITQTGYPRPLLRTANGATGASPIVASDEILLMTGSATDYGDILTSIVTASATNLLITPAPGQTPVLNSVKIVQSANLYFKGITIQTPSPSADQISVIGQNGVTASNIVFDGMSVSTFDYGAGASWTQTQYHDAMTFNTGSTTDNRAGFSANNNSHCTALINSHFFDLLNGVSTGNADRLFIYNNEIDHFGYDGLDYNGTNVVIRHNHVHDPINLSPTILNLHMDFMQGQDGPIASHDVYIEGNKIIFQEDPALPFTALVWATDGLISNTNSQWTNFFVNDNLLVQGPVFVAGLNFGACNDCAATHNTVVGLFTINIFNPGSLNKFPSVNITVANNLVLYMKCTDPAATVKMTNNVVMHTGTSSSFCNGGSISSGSATGTYGNGNIIDTGGITTEINNIDQVGLVYDFGLKAGAPAIGFGTPALPRIMTDYNGHSMNSPPDAGALAH